MLGKANAADQALATACQIFDRLGNRHGIARATLVLRNAADKNRLPMSLAEALGIFREHGDRANEALALARLGKHERDEAMVQEGLTIAKDIGELRTEAEAWSNLASLTYGREGVRLAEKTFRESRRSGSRQR